MKNANERSLFDHGSIGTLQDKLNHLRKKREQKEKYERIINAGIAKWVKDFQDGRIQIKTVDDLKKLIEISLILQRDDDIKM
jgi:TorA maturation chaperone TorD